MTKLQATLPKGDRNGLVGHTDTFVSDPTRLHVIIAIVHTGRATTASTRRASPRPPTRALHTG